jgi:hypothetical protein
MDVSKQRIIDLFNQNVKGKKSDTTKSNQKHCGKEGHWLENQMGIAPNGKNDADLYGYEMKNQTRSKITFGDWQADEYIFQHGRPKKKHNTNKNYQLTRDEFLQIFGKPNTKKKMRYSWSGDPAPKIDSYNDFGQKLIIDQHQNIIACYNYAKDLRENKSTIVPLAMQLDNLVIAKWNKTSLKTKLENKFNQRGWFSCIKDKKGIYYAIHFGKPINFDTWIDLVKQGIVFFDSGMYQGNSRPYAMWRANNSFWNSLIIDEYE